MCLSIKKLAIATAGGAVLASLVTAALAAGIIEERQGIMKQNGDAMKVLAAIVRKEAPFDPAVVKTNAESIASQLNKAQSLFPEGSDKGDKETWAKAEIWSEPDVFTARLEETIAAASNLAKVTEETGFVPALMALGDGCKGCHDKFQRPKD